MDRYIVTDLCGTIRLLEQKLAFYLGTSSMNCKVTGEGDVVDDDVVKKTIDIFTYK